MSSQETNAHHRRPHDQTRDNSQNLLGSRLAVNLTVLQIPTHPAGVRKLACSGPSDPADRAAAGFPAAVRCSVGPIDNTRVRCRRQPCAASGSVTSVAPGEASTCTPVSAGGTHSPPVAAAGFGPPPRRAPSTFREPARRSREPPGRPVNPWTPRQPHEGSVAPTKFRRTDRRSSALSSPGAPT